MESQMVVGRDTICGLDGGQKGLDRVIPQKTPCTYYLPTIYLGRYLGTLSTGGLLLKWLELAGKAGSK